VEGWAEAIMAWLEGHEGPLGYIVLGLASMIEYVVPPFPGDTVALFGVFLASTARWHLALVYVALNAGAIAGGMIAYAFGRAIAPPERRPRWLRGPRSERAIERITARYRKHGAAYLAINRFVPALRAFFFVGAGIAGLRPGAVALWGGLSAAVWNALLLALGWGLGANWERMLEWARLYSAAATALVIGAIAVVAARAAYRHLRRGSASDGQ
jgi:membrane protein DedA with SNARE-associated domain